MKRVEEQLAVVNLGVESFVEKSEGAVSTFLREKADELKATALDFKEKAIISARTRVADEAMKHYDAAIEKTRTYRIEDPDMPSCVRRGARMAW